MHARSIGREELAMDEDLGAVVVRVWKGEKSQRRKGGEGMRWRTESDGLRQELGILLERVPAQMFGNGIKPCRSREISTKTVFIER